MTRLWWISLSLVTFFLAAIPTPATSGPLVFPGERHLKNVRQLTFGGENAEAYFSSDGKQLIFQSTHGERKCDQIYIMDVGGGNVRMVSTGLGRTTCSYFFPHRPLILYSSTHMGGPACPPRPSFSRGYVWALYKDYDIFTANPDGHGLRRLTHTPGYDAEATLDQQTGRIVFTSVRDGDLEIYVMAPDGSNVRRLTFEPGYDGGAFFSLDGRQIVYRAHHPKDARELADYRALLKEGLIRPSRLEIFVMNSDGTGKRQVTRNGAANFAPYFHPDGKRIIFSSNLHDPRGRDFDLYLIRADGTGLERLTFNPTFDGFPMFSHDGKKLVFASNRNNRRRGETNIFIADWVP